MTRYAPQWLQSGSYAGSQDRRLLQALWPAAASAGAAATVAGGNMTVNLAAGQVAVPSQNNTGSTLCTWDAAEAVTHAAAPGSGTNRIDVITCHPRGADLDGGANNDFIIDIVQGTAAVTPVAPAVPAGQVALWQVYVTGGNAALVAGNITDVRPGGLVRPRRTGRPAHRAGIVAHRSAAPSVPLPRSTPPAARSCRSPCPLSPAAGTGSTPTVLAPSRPRPARPMWL